MVYSFISRSTISRRIALLQTIFLRIFPRTMQNLGYLIINQMIKISVFLLSSNFRELKDSDYATNILYTLLQYVFEYINSCADALSIKA